MNFEGKALTKSQLRDLSQNNKLLQSPKSPQETNIKFLVPD